MMLRGMVAAVAVAAVSAGPVRAQSPDKAELLRRMGAYVQTFVDNFTNVVAEEDYRQQFRQAAGRRRLKSDFLLVGYPGQDRILLTFRDVLEVNGRPVGDQHERTIKLFLEPFESAVRRAGEIQREASRHSLDRGRLADPLLVMAYLQDDYHSNFEFTLRGMERDLGADVREIELVQVTERGASQAPVRARAWVAESSGRVVKTELRMGIAPRVQFTTTTFGVDPVLGIDVPTAMHDAVPYPADEFLGEARYSNFRRFQVRAESQVDLPTPE